MYGARDGRLERGKRRSRDVRARLLAVSALLVAAWIVLAVLNEAREPSVAAPASQIRPLPTNLFRP
jgi:hypothetical protein